MLIGSSPTFTMTGVLAKAVGPRIHKGSLKALQAKIYRECSDKAIFEYLEKAITTIQLKWKMGSKKIAR